MCFIIYISRKQKICLTVDYLYLNMSGSSTDSSICVHPLTGNPTLAWEKIKNSQKVLKIQPPIPKGPVANNKVCTYLPLILMCLKKIYIYFRYSSFNIFDLRSGSYV